MTSYIMFIFAGFIDCYKFTGSAGETILDGVEIVSATFILAFDSYLVEQFGGQPDFLKGILEGGDGDLNVLMDEKPPLQFKEVGIGMFCVDLLDRSQRS